MTNNQLIFMLKRIFDTFDTSSFAYTHKKDENDEIFKLYLSQNRDKQTISHKVEGILPIDISRIRVTSKNINIIKNKLDILYSDAVKHNIFVEIKLLDCGIRYKVYDIYNNKLLYKDRIVLKSFFNIIYYVIYLIRQ